MNRPPPILILSILTIGPRSPGGAPTAGDGVAFKGDVIGLLQSLPDEGELGLRVLSLSGPEQDSTFSLDGMQGLRARISATCKWPHAMAKPNDPR